MQNFIYLIVVKTTFTRVRKNLEPFTNLYDSALRLNGTHGTWRIRVRLAVRTGELKKSGLVLNRNCFEFVRYRVNTGNGLVFARISSTGLGMENIASIKLLTWSIHHS